MKIIPKFQQGGIPQWYLNLYKQHALTGWNNRLNKNFSNQNLNVNGHYNAGDLSVAYEKNREYTNTPEAITQDIQSFYDSDGKGMSAKEYENFYNSKADIIRGHWNTNQTYGQETANIHNPLFSRMFKNRSNSNLNNGGSYNIGYQTGLTKNGYNIENIEGSSTWLRRMDRYENDDLENPDRIHEITLKDGTKARYYKEKNGNIKLLENPSPNNPPSETPQKPNPQPQQTGGSTEVGSGPTGDKKETPQQGNDLLERLRGMIPGLLSTGRLAGNLINSARVYNEALKGIKPTLIQPYYTHRQVVGDEATKQAYYRRAAAGQTRAAQPFTSDADRQMAYMQEARRVGDELRAQGDLADNQEIRRTSDESNQHQWANTQRATEVANTNLASLNDANEKKHTLLAQKHSAQWSSIDNYLKEIETRKRQQMEEDNAYNKQIDLLDLENELANDEGIKQAQENLLKLAKRDQWNNPVWDEKDKDVIAARTALANAQYKVKKKYYTGLAGLNRKYSSPFFIKSGSKITYKKDDKLLYKSTKDVVDHFRKMCRRYPDRERKIQKLAPHPGSSRKYQVGGQFLAPFTIYTPAVGVGETTRTVSQDSTGTSSKAASSSKDTSSKDILDLIKMFKDLKGIKVDVSSIYSTLSGVLQEAEIFGKELNSQQIASMYLRAMQQLNNVSRSKEIYDKAYEVAVANGALNEIAVDSFGNYAVQNKETGKIETVSKIDISKHIPLTNSQLLTLREYRPDLAFDKGDSIMQNIVANGIGLPKIAEQIKSMAGKLGNSELKLDGMSEVESNQVKQGIKLLQGAPDGHYKTTTETKNQLAQKQAAINYIMQMLPENYKAVLDIHGGAKNLIPTFLSSQIDDSQTVNFSPLTGKAASNKDGNSEGDGNMLPSMAFFNGEGEKSSFIIQDKTNDGLRINTISTPITSKGYNTGSITFNKLESSDFGGQLLINQATMGDSLISSTGRNNIIIDGRIYQTELPIDQEAKRTSGIIKPDLRFLKNIEKADSIIRQKGLNKSDPKDIPAINKIYQENNLPILYTISNNKPTITSEYARFAIVNGIGTEDAFGDNPEFNDAIQEISSDKEREQFEIMMQQQGNSKYKLNNGIGLFGHSVGETKLYKGTIYIPMVTSNISALAGTGFKAKAEEYNQIEAKQQAADAAREMGFNPAGDVSNLK